LLLGCDLCVYLPSIILSDPFSFFSLSITCFTPRLIRILSSTFTFIEGYLNLFANVVDNFTHGVAIGGSYLVSLRLGILTTICILVHEVPHEMGDFVILLRNGFTRWQAAKAQFNRLLFVLLTELILRVLV
uniref:Peptidase_M50 domain-containing protein n=1 Tax=Echinostoma caproni TaxID=27848 RepID=A0A183AP87_9TREM